VALDYQFRSLTPTDLPMVQRWLEMPHVIEWWGDPVVQFELVSGDLKESAMNQFVVSNSEKPFGYLQYMDLRDWMDEAFLPQPEGTLSIDQFIGEPDMIGKGHGSAFIRALVSDLLAGGAPRVITDPDPSNLRAIRTYENAGFRKERVVAAIDGASLLMVCNA